MRPQPNRHMLRQVTARPSPQTGAVPDEVPALDTRRPFTRTAALRSGIRPRELGSPSYARVFTGIYLDAAVTLTPRLRVVAALLPFGEGAFASHASAARVLGLPIPTLADEHVTVLDKRHRRNRPGVVCHFVREAEVIEVDGIRVSGYERVFVELAGQLGLVDLVVVGDHLVRRRRTTIEKLRAVAAESMLPGTKQALAALRLVRERVDSPMETRLRLLLVLAGLPEPQVNLTIRDVNGVPTRRYDLCWPEARLIVEYDGRHHVERIEQWESDLDRREAIDDDGWRILVVTAKGVYSTPQRTVTKVWRLLAERGQPGVPLRLSDDWRPHFPVRD